VRSPLADSVPTSAINIRRVFHRRTLGAAILAIWIRRASAIWMRTFLRCFVGHFSFLSSQSFAFIHRAFPEYRFSPGLPITMLAAQARSLKIKMGD
jgi:hypothetical protein